MNKIEKLYEEAEREGRDRFKKYCDDDYMVFHYQELPRECRQDCQLLSGIDFSNVIIEIKNRNINSKSKLIQEGGVLLEYAKMIELYKYVRDKGFAEAFYVSFFNNGVGYMFPISKLKDKMQWVKETKYKEKTVEKSNFREKIVTYLPIEWGIEIKY